MTEEEDGGTCAVCGVPLDDDASWYADFGSPDHGGDEVVACSQEHLARAVAAWVEPPDRPAEKPGRAVRDRALAFFGPAVGVVLVVWALGLMALGSYQLVQLFGGWQ